MKYFCFRLSILIAAVSVLSYANAYRDNDLTAEVPSGRKECFYQPTKSGQSLEIEYQVIDGGDLDIDFRVSGPKGNPVVTEYRQNDGMHTIEPTEEGDYEICFDNSFSRFTKKSVFFELIIDNGVEDDELDDKDGNWKKFTSPDEIYGDQVATLEAAGDTINVIKTSMAKTIQTQGLLRAFEAKDRNVVERNYMRINFWSITNIFVMLVVVGLQVYMVRNMFSDKRKVRT